MSGSAVEEMRASEAEAADYAAFVQRVKSCYSADALARPPSRNEVIDLVLSTYLQVAQEIGKSKREYEKKFTSLNGMRYLGIYQRAQSYTAGSAVTHAGSIFVALRDCAPLEVPGSAGPWQLAVKGAS